MIDNLFAEIQKKEFSKKYADILLNYLSEYEWSKCIHVSDYSNLFGSKQAKFELYDKVGQIITPYFSFDNNGRTVVKSYPEDSQKFSGEIQEFQKKCIVEVNSRWNIWVFIIYPDGRYESKFEWDEQAHEKSLITNVKNHFSWLYQEAIYKIQDELFPEKTWEKAFLTLQFHKGKIQPLQFEIPYEGEIFVYSILIKNFRYEEYPQLTEDYEEMYELAHQESLKDKLWNTWNKVTIELRPDNMFNDSTWQQLKFEWIDEV